MSDPIIPSVSVSRDIPASAADIFAILANPSMHPRLDGTGMAQSADSAAVITKVGDVFVINMMHWSLGEYGMENHVVDFEVDRRIVWEPFAHTYQSSQFDEMMGDERPRETRYWGWELEPIETKLTRVTEFYDCSRLSDGLRSFIKDGEFWRQGMAQSLENLEQMLMTPAWSDTSKRDQPTKPRNYYQEVQESN
jgi:hypothetical protein